MEKLKLNKKRLERLLWKVAVSTVPHTEKVVCEWRPFNEGTVRFEVKVYAKAYDHESVKERYFTDPTYETSGKKKGGRPRVLRWRDHQPIARRLFITTSPWEERTGEIFVRLITSIKDEVLPEVFDPEKNCDWNLHVTDFNDMRDGYREVAYPTRMKNNVDLYEFSISFNYTKWVYASEDDILAAIEML